jgi:hypothetical protein
LGKKNLAFESFLFDSTILQQINNATSYERENCLQLHLSKIISVKRLAANDEMMRFRQSIDENGDEADLNGNMEEQFTTYMV